MFVLFVSIMLTHLGFYVVFIKLTQVKCEQYWPDQLNTAVTKGSKFTVTVTSFVPSAEYQVRKLVLKSVSL